MSLQQFALPDLGEGLTESEIVSWEVAVGDTVELNQVLGEVETAKALVELPSPFAGTISHILVEPGTTVRVGTPIIAIETADAAGSDPAPPGETSPPVEPVETPAEKPPVVVERTSVLVGYGPRVASDERPRRRHRRTDWLAAHSVPDEAVEPKHSEQQHSGPAAPEDRRVPIAGVRRRMAEAMVQSAFTAPHATVHLEVDVTETLAMMERLREHPRLAGTRVTLLTIVASACLRAIPHSPAINSRWDAEGDAIIEFAHVGLGIAVATERGLLVPHIQAADRLSFAELARAMNDLVTAARAGKATTAQLSGGSFSITNVGVFGVDSGTPILPPGEAAILALGAVRRRPWEYRGEIALRSVATLSLSFDHRLIDGKQGSEFLVAVGSMLKDPGSVVAYA